jgi:acetyl esterase/lipase
MAMARDLAVVEDQAVLDDRYVERRASFTGGVVGIPDVTYARLAGYRPLTLDIYLPAQAARAGNKARFPLVLFIHGGGWYGGHPRHAGAFADWPAVLATLAARGYVVASLNYRLSAEAPSPAAIQDVKTALRWLRANATRFGIDKSRAAAWGGSAGGQLAALAAVSCGVAELEPPAQSMPADVAAESDCVQAAVTWYGIFDFRPLMANASQQSAPIRYVACEPANCPVDKVRMASPAMYVSAKTPPMLLIHGASDRVAAPQQSKDFYALLQAQGVRSQLIMIPDVDHSFIGKTPATTRAASLQALQASFDFFDAMVGMKSR